MPSPHENAENLGAVGVVCGFAGAGAMLPYLEIIHTESHCHVDLCLIMPNFLWKLFGLDVPNVMSAQVDGKKLKLGTSCRRERVKLNDGKTEIIVIRRNLRNVSVANFGVMSFGDNQLVPCESAKNLGVVLDLH